MSYVLALDQGTTSSRAVLVDASERVVETASAEFPQHYPQPGWVEHDPEDLWETQRASAEQVLEKAGVAAEAVIAIGLTNQRETTLLWRRSDGQPLHPAIVWQDRRTSEQCEQMRADGLTPFLRNLTGLLPDPYFSATKLAWLLENIPGARTQAEAGELAFGTVDSWLLWRLTGGETHRTDRTNASRTLLWNLREEQWDEELLAFFRIPPSLLPEVLPSSASFGTAVATGIPRAPIAGVAGDQQAALVGQAGWAAGAAKNTYGTGCFLLLHTGETAPDPGAGLLATAACAATGNGYAVEGSVFIAGAAVQWLRDELGLVSTAAETEVVAQSVPDSGGVYVVPAFTGLGAPYWDANARGTIVGLTRGSGRAQIVRATLESIALQVCDVVEAMTESGTAPECLRVDGGASDNDFLMQLQADLLGIPVERAAIRETTALGAAYLAGLGVGLWQPGELEQLWRADRVFTPSMSADQRESLRAGWRRAVERSREWVMVDR